MAAVQFTLAPEEPVMPQLVVELSPFVCAVFVRFMFFSVTFWVLVSVTPLPVLFEMVPPVPAEVLVPVTVSPPELPVILRTIPGFALAMALVELMLRNVTPLAPIVVFAMFSAVPVVDVMVLPAP